MGITAEAERTVELPRERAFELFIDYSRWHEWMPRDFRPVSGPDRPLVQGDRLKVRIPPITAHLKVLRVRPGEEICWGGGVPGLRAEHSFYFEDAGPGRTRIRSVEPWTGALTKVGPLAARLKKEAERIGAAQLDGFLELARARATATA
ncbi:MAG: SRPBCC family protein [Myxococcota bacterium]